MRQALATFLKKPTPFSILTKSGPRPPKVALVQTDGSFSTQYVEMSRTAVILRTNEHIDYTLIDTYIDHINSTESEWVSVLSGIEFALKKDQGSVELENDCLPVIKHLIFRKPPAKSYLADYYSQIFKESRKMEYLGVRWIPRELNKADDLFRI
uniref:RNase H type-1 domain-containing protein n=1 Tax=viral metagenome TaxID=1070528 RepID=A0A6C0APJ6_9ZZZZ